MRTLQDKCANSDTRVTENRHLGARCAPGPPAIDRRREIELALEGLCGLDEHGADGDGLLRYSSARLACFKGFVESRR